MLFLVVFLCTKNIMYYVHYHTTLFFCLYCQCSLSRSKWLQVTCRKWVMRHLLCPCMDCGKSSTIKHERKHSMQHALVEAFRHTYKVQIYRSLEPQHTDAVKQPFNKPLKCHWVGHIKNPMKRKAFLIIKILCPGSTSSL